MERRKVKIGASHQGMYVIQEGLSGDEWVVVKGILKAIPGRQVTPEKDTPEDKTGQGPQKKIY